MRHGSRFGVQVWLHFLLPFGVLCAQSNQAPENPTSAFQAVAENYLEKLPTQFLSKLQGEEMERIIAERIIEPSGRKDTYIYVELAYTEPKGIEIRVRNVDPVYEDLFEWYAQQMNFLTLPLQHPEAISQVFEVSSVPESNKSVQSYRVAMRYGEPVKIWTFTVHAQTLEIQRVLYQEAQQKMLQADIQFTNLNVDNSLYALPQTVQIEVFQHANIAGEDLSQGTSTFTLSDYHVSD